MKNKHIFKNIVFPKKLRKLKELLAPYSKRVYLVGGSVRDLLLGKKPHDFDIEVYDINQEQFEKLMNEIGAKGVGKSFFVFKLYDIDISLPRIENKTGNGHKDFEVTICNDERTASLRRDFTMNAMMLNLFTNELLDFHNGQVDLKNKIIRHVDDSKFVEDNLRVLRAIRFSASLGFDIAPKTKKLIKKLSLDYISKHRIAEELVKIFQTKNQDIAVKYLNELGLFKKLFGINLDKKTEVFFGKKVRRSFLLTRDKRQFLYILRGRFNVKEKILEDLALPKAFKSCFEQPYKENADRRFLLKMSFSMPISSWLGANTKRIIYIAKENGIYEKTIDIKINGKDIIKEGFVGEAIGKEIERKKDFIVDQILKGELKR